eukprot:5969334-Pleurochrysis_carterae.AAC.1
MVIASSTAVTFRSNAKVRTEQLCVSVGDATRLSRGAVDECVDAGRHGDPGGDGGADGVAAPARSGSRVRRTQRLALFPMEHDCLSTSTALSASSKAAACMVVRWG